MVMMVMMVMMIIATRTSPHAATTFTSHAEFFLALGQAAYAKSFVYRNSYRILSAPLVIGPHRHSFNLLVQSKMALLSTIFEDFPSFSVHQSREVSHKSWIT
jgi:hypothetical protein